MVIALFRHGLTEENKRKAYLGWNDSPLYAESKGMSTTKSYERYYSSDLQRCICTAELLFPNSNLCLLENLREMNFGEWERKTYDELKENRLYRLWLSDPITHCPPKGESFHEFITRVDAGWNQMIDEVLSQRLQSCAVITHGGVIRYLLSQFAPEPQEFWSWPVKHNQGYELIFERDGLRRGDRCTLLLEVPLTAKEHG
ncbi:histidine phosphatase family protein [Neobacillus soli]|uniref:histidine phosphatase family protein n=1 Tax=Neobacillus soli TaxID=220688 RepID=UPI000A3EABD2|nr:histidine phosphatase family protein [Neobacillus soli]